MTVLAQNEKLTATFQAVCDHLTHADPNDFDSQIPPTFVSCDAEQNTVVCSFEVKKSFGNPHGNMHGGLIAAMIDSAQGSTIASICGLDTHIVTVSLQVSYLKPSPGSAGRRPYCLLLRRGLAAGRRDCRHYRSGLSHHPRRQTAINLPYQKGNSIRVEFPFAFCFSDDSAHRYQPACIDPADHNTVFDP